jgi:hypothetical protein
MTGPAAARLPGDRLHLQHGPIDLVIGAEGAREAAFAAAARRFATILEELVAELPTLRHPLHLVGNIPGGGPIGPGGQRPPPTPLTGETARRMHAAAAPHAALNVTPMAAVAGAVAETVLRAMVDVAELSRAYVNNGGDIALHLAPGTRYRAALAGLDGSAHGTATIRDTDPVRGIATSGRGGRSLSLGIADSVTVLARTAPEADVAATLIANAVDLPGHAAIARAPACELQPDSDLGARPVVTGLGPLTAREIAEALSAGAARAEAMRRAGLIHAAALTLCGETRTTAGLAVPQRRLTHA